MQNAFFAKKEKNAKCFLAHFFLTKCFLSLAISLLKIKKNHANGFS